MKNMPKIIAAASIGFLCANLYAFDFGEMRLASTLGEPFDAYVNVYAAPGDDPASIRLQVLPDLAYAGNRALTRSLEGFTATLERGENGRPYIHVRGSGSSTDAVVAFRLKAFQTGGALVRSYAVAPAAPPQRIAGVAPPVRARARAPSLTAREIALRTPGGEYGPVRPGETLWAIAARISGSGTSGRAALVRALFAANPQAFIAGDIDRLKAGARLTIPAEAAGARSGAEQVAVTSPIAPGRATIRAPIRAPHTSAASAATPSVAAVSPLQDPASAVVDREPDARQGPAVDWRTRDPALAARLAALEEKYAAIRKRYATPQPLAQTTAGKIPSPVAAGGAPRATAKPHEPAHPTATVAPERADTPPPAVQKSRAPAHAPMLSAIPPLAIAYATGAILLIIMLPAAVRRVRDMVHGRPAAVFDPIEEQRKADIQRKAASRIEMEMEVKRLIEGKRNGAAAQKTSQSPAGSRAPASSGARTTASDRQIVIDASVAHGRYLEAEKLLQEVIAETPRNHAAKLRLAEVYYLTARIDEFLRVVADILDHHRADISDDDWRRITRMGKVIAPDKAPFSGPRMVARDSAAR